MAITLQLNIGKRVTNKKIKSFSRNIGEQGPAKTVFCKKISESLILE